VEEIGDTQENSDCINPVTPLRHMSTHQAADAVIDSHTKKAGRHAADRLGLR
jgi:hypothetical protein